MLLPLFLATALLAASDKPGATDVDAQLQEAQRLASGLRYAASLERLKDVEQLGGLTRDQLAAVWQLQARTFAVLDQPEAAAGAFAKLLSLRPDFVLPPGTSPRISDALSVARIRRQGAPGIAVQRERVAGPLALRIVNDTEHLGAAMKLHVRVGDSVEERRIAISNDLVVVDPPAPEFQFWAELVTAREDQLAELGSAFSPILEVPAASNDGSPRLRTASIITASVGAAALLTGAGFGLDARSVRAEFDSRVTVDEQGRTVGMSQADAQRLQTRIDRESTTANVLFAAGTAAILTGVVLWFASDR